MRKRIDDFEAKASMSQLIFSRAARLSGMRSKLPRIAWRHATAAVVLVVAYLPLVGGLWRNGWSGAALSVRSASLAARRRPHDAGLAPIRPGPT